MLVVLAATAALYAVWVVIRLGLHQRLPLALGPVGLERIPERAARRYGDAILFTTDEPCAWTPPGMAATHPDPRAWSALRIHATAGYVAGLLDRLGVRPGDRVAVLKRNHLDMHVFAAAIVRAGGIACPINDQFPADVVGDYLRHLDARFLVSDPDTLDRLLAGNASFGPVRAIVLADRRGPAGTATCALLRSRHADIATYWIEEELRDAPLMREPVRRESTDVHYLVHSSGTTGFPKAVMLTNRAQSHAVRGWLCYVHLSRTFDRGYLAVPNNHQAVMLTFHSTLLLGLRVHWIGAYARVGFDAGRVVRELAEGRYTGYFGFPITYTQLKEVPLARRALGRMRFWATTADASHEMIMRPFVAVGGTFRSFGLPLDGSVFLDAQGSSEVGTPSVLRYYTRFTRKYARRIGRPGSTPFGPDVRIAIDGVEVPRGRVGRLEVRGRTVFAGYWRNGPLTRLAIRDGWFFTGDVARRGADGHLVQLDREVDVIHTRSGPVYSLPIEEVLHRHPAVFDLCVFGARQPDGSQLPAAAVALRDGHEMSAAALQRELDAMLPPAERLASVAVMPWADFPIGVTGKTLKRVFRERSETTVATPRDAAGARLSSAAASA